VKSVRENEEDVSFTMQIGIIKGTVNKNISLDLSALGATTTDRFTSTEKHPNLVKIQQNINTS